VIGQIRTEFKMPPRPPPRVPYRPREQFTTFTWDEADNLIDLFVLAGEAMVEYGKQLKPMSSDERHEFTLMNLSKTLNIRESVFAVNDDIGIIAHRCSETAQMIKNAFGRKYEPAHFSRFKKMVSRG
jgi:hypothetical protein